MTIETKYNIGDEVWVKREGQASKGIIVSITAFADCIREKTGDMWILLVGETPNFDKYEEAMEAGLKFILENLA